MAITMFLDLTTAAIQAPAPLDQAAQQASAALHAQQVSAWWTRAAAITSVLLGLGTLFLVQRQLKQNTLALKHASEAAIISFNSSRPWIKLMSLASSIQNHPGPIARSFHMSATWQNVGKMPATNVHVELTLWNDIPSRMAAEARIAEFEARVRVTKEIGQTLFPDDTLTNELSHMSPPLDPNGSGSFVVAVLASYDVVGESAGRLTPAFYQFNVNPENSLNARIFYWERKDIGHPAT